MDMETYAQAYIFLVVNKRLYKRLCPPVYPGVCKAKVEKLEYGHFHHLSLVQILEWAFFSVGTKKALTSSCGYRREEIIGKHWPLSTKL